MPKKGLGQFAEGLAKNKEEGAFEAGRDIYIYLDAQYDLILVHAET